MILFLVVILSLSKASIDTFLWALFRVTNYVHIGKYATPISLGFALALLHPDGSHIGFSVFINGSDGFMIVTILAIFAPHNHHGQV
jgi:hypothetical protein